MDKAEFDLTKVKNHKIIGVLLLFQKLHPHAIG